MSSDHRIVLVTAPAGEAAARIAHALVAERLAACVNIVPGCRSIFRWEGRTWDADTWNAWSAAWWSCIRTTCPR